MIQSKVKKTIFKVAFLAVLFFLFSNSTIFAYSSKAINAYAVEIYDTKNAENVQGIRKTKYDYNDEVFVRIYAFGRFFEEKPNVKIGNSQGNFISQKPIVKQGNIIGYDMIFKFTTVQSGDLQVFIGRKLFSRSVFVK